MKWYKIILIVIIFLSLLTVPIVFTWYGVVIDHEKSYGIPELVYYTAQIVGVMAMSGAVFVAIFGTQIQRFLFGEKCSASIVDGGFTEKLSNVVDTTNPASLYYDCSLLLKNIGNREIVDCQIQVLDVYYKANRDAKYKNILPFINHPLYWNHEEEKSYTLLTEEQHKFPLYRIYPQNSCQTPDNSDFSPLCIRVFGCKLDDRYTQKGYWKTKYVVRSHEKILLKFEVEVQWDGTWHSRINEMNEVVNVNLKEI